MVITSRLQSFHQIEQNWEVKVYVVMPACQGPKKCLLLDKTDILEQPTHSFCTDQYVSYVIWSNVLD